MNDTILSQLEEHIEGVLKGFSSDIAAIRGSRPSPALVEDIVVDYYGQSSPIKQLGSISVIPPREIQISMWDASVVETVAKAVSEKLKVQASPDGNVLHIQLPSLTQERKDELIRMIKARAEDARIKSRTFRDDIKSQIDDAEEEGSLTEDDKFRLYDDMKKIMDGFNTKVEELVEKKIKDIQE